MVGQLIGPGIQGPVAQPLLFIPHRHRLGASLGLCLKELVDTPPLGILNLGGIPFHQHLLPLRLAQER